MHGLGRLAAEEAGEAPEDLPPALVGLQQPGASRVVALEEREHDARRAAAVRGVVERRAHGADVAGGLSGEPLVAPERTLVDRHALPHRALRHALCELVAMSREDR